MDRNRSLKSIRRTVGMIFLIAGQVLAISGIPDLISQSLHVRKADSAGIIMTAFGITLLVSNLVVGKLIDKVGAKKLLYLSLPLTAVILWGYPLAEDSTFALTMVRIVHGFFYALVVNTIFFVTRNSVSERHQARVSLLSGACIYLGSGFAMYAGLSWLVNTRILWHVVIVLGIASTVLLFMGVALREHSWVSIAQKARELVSRLSSMHPFKGAIHKEAFFLALPGLGLGVAYSSFLTWFANYWQEDPGMVLLLATMGNAAVAFTVMPPLAKSTKGYFPLMVSSNLLMVVSLIMIWKGQSLQIMILAGILIGFAVCGNNSSILEAILRKVDRSQHGAATGTHRFMLQLGSNVIGTAYSSVMWGFLRDQMWPAMIPFLLLSLVSLFFIRKRYSKVDEVNEIQKPLDPAVVRGETAVYLAQGLRKQYEEKLSVFGIDDLDNLPPCSQEKKLTLCLNVEEALWYLEMVKIKNGHLPVDGLIFQLQGEFLQLLMELESHELSAYTLGKEISSNPIERNAEFRRIHASRLKDIRESALWQQDPHVLLTSDTGDDMFTRIGLSPSYQTSDLLLAVQALGVVDISEVMEAYKTDNSMASSVA